MAIAQDNIAKLIAEQIAVALAAQKSRRLQTPSNPDRHRQDSADRRRPDSVIDTVKPLTSRDTHFQDGLIHGTEAQKLSDGLDLTFNA
jgi:hypothetical protein